MNEICRKPNLFIVGEPRSGTTALYNYLKAHPQIFFPESKEPTHFATYHFKEQNEIRKRRLNLIKSNIPKYYHRKNYLALYKNREEKYLGDASTKYLYSKEAAKRIYKFNPQAKIIALFREPVAFLQSYHSKQLFILNENERNLIKALSLEKLRKYGKNLPKSVKASSSLLYSKRLQYSKHIQRFLEYFPSKQIKVIIFEDFKRNNMKALSEIYNFLNVNENRFPKLLYYNKNRTVRNRNLKRLFENSIIKSILKRLLPKKLYSIVINLINQLIMVKNPPYSLNPHIISSLKKRFRNEVIELNKILTKNNLINCNLLEKWGY